MGLGQTRGRSSPEERARNITKKVTYTTSGESNTAETPVEGAPAEMSKEKQQANQDAAASSGSSLEALQAKQKKSPGVQ